MTAPAPGARFMVRFSGCREWPAGSDLLPRAPMPGAATEGEDDEVHTNDAVPAVALENSAPGALAEAGRESAHGLSEAVQPGAHRRRRVRAHRRPRRPGANENRARDQDWRRCDH